MATLGLAPLQPRALAFSPDVRSDLRLLEVDDALLKEITEAGVVVKGNENEEAVLCTSSRTFAMKLVETTNLQLLVRPSLSEGGASGAADAAPARAAPMGVGQGLMTQWEHFRASDSHPPIQVCATNTSHIELVEVAPRLRPLREMLWRWPYGLEDEGAAPEPQQGAMDADAAASSGRGRGTGCSAGRGGYSFEELLAAVQASPGELRAALSAEGALELSGRWRAVDPAYLGGLLEVLLLTAEQEGMPLSALREADLVSSLEADGDYHPAVVRHCLRVYGKPAAEGAGTWSLDPAKVGVHFAHKLLLAAAAGRGGSSVSGMSLQEFTAAWSDAVPHGITPSLDWLRAEALVDGTGAEARISAFPAARLPADPAERFAALFRRRPRWDWVDLEPYLAGIKVPGQSVEALLIRFARASQETPESPLVYSAR